jgi:SOS-response transcriptional repressor LexA
MTAFGLTAREQDALTFIRKYAEEHPGRMPSLTEITDGLGLRSRSGTHRVLLALEERGHLVVLKRRARGIKLVDPNALQDLPERLTTRLLAYATFAGMPPAAVLNIALTIGLGALERKAFLTKKTPNL